MFGFGPKLDITKIRQELTAGSAVLVDVREPVECDAGHASGAINLSVNRINRGEVPNPDTSKKVYLYCVSGGRAGNAAHLLKQKGYDTENIGGLSGWRAAGGSVES